jgi:hypothetical protein
VFQLSETRRRQLLGVMQRIKGWLIAARLKAIAKEHVGQHDHR